MRRAEYAQLFDLLIMDHAGYECDQRRSDARGVLSTGWVCADGRVWEKRSARNILGKKIGARMYCQHISSAESVSMIRRAKSEGVKVMPRRPHIWR